MEMFHTTSSVRSGDYIALYYWWRSWNYSASSLFGCLWDVTTILWVEIRCLQPEICWFGAISWLNYWQLAPWHNCYSVLEGFGESAWFSDGILPLQGSFCKCLHRIKYCRKIRQLDESLSCAGFNWPKSVLLASSL